jgi:hemerythrin
MARVFWTSQLNVGIEVIDQQHRRIVEYINQLEDAASQGHTQNVISALINELVDYTVSHFGFEESLQEEAGYPFIKAHKKVHELFTRRIAEFQARMDKGEDITEELNTLLVSWLLNHIKSDDADYASTVRTYLQQDHNFVQQKRSLFARLFG